MLQLIVIKKEQRKSISDTFLQNPKMNSFFYILTNFNVCNLSARSKLGQDTYAEHIFKQIQANM